MGDAPESLTRLREIQPYATALVMGALGGCSIAVSKLIKQKRAEWLFSLLCAYALVGAFGALMGMALLAIFAPTLIASFAQVVFAGGAFGLCAAAGLFSANVVMRVVLKQLGIDVEIKISRDRVD